MKALLLAAGVGSRLSPLTDIIPKCLIPINGVPLLDFWIDRTRKFGIEATVNLHYRAELVEAYLDSLRIGDDLRRFHEIELLNTAGTVKANYSWFKGDTLLLVHADNLSWFSMEEFLEAHRNRPEGTEITMMTFRTDMPETCGIVELNEDGVMVAFHEKVKNPPGNLANAAVYLLEPSVIDRIASFDKDVIDFSLEILPEYTGRINTWENAQYHRDVGNLTSLLNAQLEYPYPSPVVEKRDRNVMTEVLDRLALTAAETIRSVDGSANYFHDLEALERSSDDSGSWNVVRRLPGDFSAQRYHADSGRKIFGIEVFEE